MEKYDVDYVFECTGKFNSKDKLEAHLKMEQKSDCFSSMQKADKTIVYGVNEVELKVMIKLFQLHRAQPIAWLL